MQKSDALVIIFWNGNRKDLAIFPSANDSVYFKNIINFSRSWMFNVLSNRNMSKLHLICQISEYK